MKHICPNCHKTHDCKTEKCENQKYELCSRKCIEELKKKQNIQHELSEKLFPDGEWH